MDCLDHIDTLTGKLGQIISETSCRQEALYSKVLLSRSRLINRVCAKIFLAKNPITKLNLDIRGFAYGSIEQPRRVKGSAWRTRSCNRSKQFTLTAFAEATN
jgi:hypothetical protein